MWIVRLALRRPYTFVVMAFLIAILGALTISRMATDIFPEIDIPVISVVWNYPGLPPQDLEERVVSNYERALTTTVNDIEHIESQTLYGVAVIKIFFQPGAKIEAATAQVTAISQTVIRQMPPGITPPLVMQYSASNVPILQMALESDSLTEQQMFDEANSFLRTGIATIRGAQMPWPYGGKVRQVMVDLDLDKLAGWGLSPSDVSAAVSAQNLILPSGTVKVGTHEFPVELNSSPLAVDDLNNLPIKTVNGTTIFIRDVAHVRDGYAPQNSVVHANGKKAVLVSILKAGGASTLEVVARIRAALPGIMATLPKELKINLLMDQSIFVRAAVEGVLREGAIAAGLTALMILLFLGSWRSTVIILVSIPLSILVSVIVLGALGQTLNTMTLGGMALAVGILVDDATVEIENIHRNLGQRKPLVRAILDGASQIAVPAFVSTTCICIVFVPVVFISGSAKSLFIPMALAVSLAMMTSYFLSRTLVPTMVHKLLEPEVQRHLAGHVDTGLLAAIHGRVESGFMAIRRVYGSALAWVLAHRPPFLATFALFIIGSMGLVPLLGRDFFPSADAGQIRLHVRGRPGTRLEESELTFGKVEQVIREVIPPAQIETLLDNIGIPNSGINLSLSDGSLVSSADGEIMIALTKDRTRQTPEYVTELRRTLHERFPDLTFFFAPPDISTQVLNFGLQAPIDIQFAGNVNVAPKNLAIAQAFVKEIAAIPGAVDVHLQQLVGVPRVRLNVDRTLASQIGFTASEVASDVLVSLASSGTVSPSYWIDPSKGTQYAVAVQTPQYRLDSLGALAATPIHAGLQGPSSLLTSVAEFAHESGPANITHNNVMPTYDVLANVQGADLGSVSEAVQQKVNAIRATLPRGATVRVRGQVESMNNSFIGLGFGILFAILLVYLLMAVNFQSWLDPVIILMALPGALAGIAWILFVTQTTLSVPALMGAMMCVGVATANSILLVTFANDQRKHGLTAHDAALAAGITRLRPVVMTAMAMVVGMLPMALGFGEGGEQNSPLGRAVVGGLILATATTLFFVPVMYSLLRTKPPRDTDFLEGEN